MSGGYRAGIMGVLVGLLVWIPAPAQTTDTLPGDAKVDTSAVADKDAPESHAEPVVLRTVADSTVAGWKSDKAFDYANDPAYWQWHEPRASSEPDLITSRGFEDFILILMGCILLYAIIRIIVANRLQLFYRPPRPSMPVKAGEEAGLAEDDLDGRLTHFMQIKDYRQAVRYLYLKSLRLLNDQGLIRYHQEATNQEYWRQLSATPQGGPFRDLVMIYEKVWYGEFPLGDTLFTRLHQYFEDFYKSVR
jgi:Domain of unknown function (DUF4129)